MKHLKCKICGHEHAGVAHVFDAINTPKQVKPAINSKPVAINNRTPNRRDRGDYNAYMREYMRKRRAA